MFIVITLLVILIVTFFYSQNAMALAGGHSGGSSGSSSVFSSSNHWSWIDLLIGIPYLSYLSYCFLTGKYKYYNNDVVSFAESSKIKQQYLAIQNAWNDRNLESVKPYYVKQLFTDHNEILRKLTAQNVINVTTNVKIDGLSRYRNKGTQFKVDISFKAIDYNLKNKKKIVSGKTYERKFKQRLTWIRKNTDVKLEKIDDIKCLF